MYRIESEFCMDLWRDMCGLEPKRERHIPSLEELKKTEWCPEFEQLMRNRLIMGAIRYRTFAENAAGLDNNYDRIGAAITRLQKYQQSGNDEYLVDVANFCVLEFRFGKHPKKHFHAKDDESHVVLRR